tara:strand:+ start:784 stop:1389 length:606 start_codon:yes stop_codon:yes gene_type:complete
VLDMMSYEEFLTNEAFPIVKDKTVLEIGALNNKITNWVKNAGASSVETVDPFGKATFRGTANDYYNQKKTAFRKFDAVICMGLLYHLHSPYHLLEQIINHTQPDILIIETGPCKMYGRIDKADGVHEELYSTIGNAWPDKEIKHPIRINITSRMEDLIRGIETTPMKLKRYWQYPDIDLMVKDFDIHNKENMWLGVFNREE